MSSPPRTSREADRLLVEAMRRTSIDDVRRAIERGADPSTSASGIPMLTLAALHGNEPLVDVLLKAGANVNAETHELRTALHVLAQTPPSDERQRIANKLIEAGININRRDRVGSTARELSVQYMNPRMTKQLDGAGVVRRHLEPREDISRSR